MPKTYCRVAIAAAALATLTTLALPAMADTKPSKPSMTASQPGKSEMNDSLHVDRSIIPGAPKKTPPRRGDYYKGGMRKW